MQNADVSTQPPLIAILAGEDSGDQLGADLIAALRQRYPQARFVGMGGARMQREGFDSWYDIRELSLFGFSEVVRHLPRLLRLRKALLGRLLRERPAVLVGIDAPDFNLGVERRLKQAGVPTVHYVSPSVWAWREQRAAKIGESANRVLCLFPMEPAIYAKHGVDARFVGHPLADRFALVADRVGARDALQLPQQAPVLAVLPGSRLSEVDRLGRVFIDAAQRVAAALPGLRVLPVDGLAIARRHGLQRIVNSALLGALACALGTPSREALARTLTEQSPKLPEANVAACADGYARIDEQLRGVAA
jgi:lipid-A-disaccharide synthase